MGKCGRKRNKATNKKGGNSHLAFAKSLRVKNRKMDLDQIQDEMHTQLQKEEAHKATGSMLPLVKPIDLELPGAGQHYCLTCARHFTNAQTLFEHQRSKQHKKQLKKALEPQYTQQEADRAAGMGAAKTTA